MLSTAAPSLTTKVAKPPLGQPRIVAIGGGTGLPTVLRAIRQAASTLADADPTALTAVVTVMDDGGSSGRLRQSLGMLPPGDVRNCLSALARRPSLLSDILNDRLCTRDGQIGHPIGNLLLAALTSTEGDFLRAVHLLGAEMDIAGRVLPATLESVHLEAAFADGGAARGETAISARGGRITHLRLERPVRPIPDVIEALVRADVIVVGPGSLYTSILPNLLVDGVAATISALNAARVYVANLMTQPGETDGYSLGDHLRAVEDHTGFDLFDYVVVNRAPIAEGAVADYAKDGSRVVDGSEDLSHITRAKVIAGDLSMLTVSGQIRHDPEVLGAILLNLAASLAGR